MTVANPEKKSFLLSPEFMARLDQLDLMSRKLLAGCREPGLQNLIYEPHRHRQVVECICETVPHRLWKYFRPNFGRRLQTVMIDVVEIE